MSGRRRRRPLPGVLAALALGVMAGCDSPEAERVRGGDVGGDPLNRGEVIRIHDGADPYYKTPCATTLDECTGPLPVSGLRTSAS